MVLGTENGLNNSYRLTKTDLASVLSAGLIVSVAVGLFPFLLNIAANQYLKHGMFRLVTYSFQNSLTGIVLNFSTFIILFCILWLLLKKTIVSSNVGLIHIVIITTAILVVNLILDILFKSVGNYSLLLIGKSTAARLRKLLAGKIPPNEFISFSDKHLTAIIIVICFILLAVILFSQFRKLKLEKTSRIIKSKYFRRFTAVSILFILIINLGILLYDKINAVEYPNIMIIIIDALRRDHLGCYGYHRDTSPHIDTLSGESTLFTNAFAQSSSTKPSIASIFVSKYPSQHNAVYNDDALDLSWITLSEVLRERRFLTAGFVENPVISKMFQFNQGFETWKVDDRRHKPTLESMEEFDEQVLSWLEKRHKRPFFAYLHYIDPHSPYMAPAALYNFFDSTYEGSIKGTRDELNIERFHDNKKDLEHLISLYDDEIRYVDSRIDKVIRKLEHLSILDDTILFILSDHGEEFLDHGNFEHSSSVYSELINIPFLVRYSKLLKEGRNDEYVQHIDIFPTITGILNINAAPLSLEGNDILSNVAKGTKDEEKSIHIICEQLRTDWSRKRCILHKNWKLIHDIESNTYQLFNIAKDQGDTIDLIKENRGVAGSLQDSLLTWAKDFGDIIKPKKVQIDGDTREKLKSLGYIK